MMLLIECVSADQLAYFLDLLGPELWGVSLRGSPFSSFVVYADTGDITWTWNPIYEVYCHG